MDVFVVANRVEAGLWAGIAIWFAIAMWRGDRRADCAVAAGAFAMFGVSDVVESHTGAWWRPWWLLVWKGLCIAALSVLFIRHVRRRRVR